MKKKPGNIFVLSILTIFLAFLAIGCNPLTAYDVEYRVSCDDNTVNITYNDEEGESQTVEAAHSPWTIAFTAEEGTDLSITGAQTRLVAVFTVTVEIYVDDEKVKESTGPTSAHTSYTLP